MPSDKIVVEFSKEELQVIVTEIIANRVAARYDSLSLEGIKKLATRKAIDIVAERIADDVRKV